MKYLSQYMEGRQTIALRKAGAFFAFSQEQLQEGKKKTNAKEGTKFRNLNGGLICPVNTSNALVEELKTIYKECIQEDIKDNGLTAIVLRELNNHEAYYTGDIESTVDALKDYPVTTPNILSVFNNKNTILAPN